MASKTFEITKDVRIWGTIRTIDPVIISGFIDGVIMAPKVTVHKGAMVVGDIITTQARIIGEVDGHIFADELVLEEHASVVGELYHRVIDLQEGALFEGRSRQHQKPKTLASAFSKYNTTDIVVPT